MILTITLLLAAIIAAVLIYGSLRWDSGAKEMHAGLEPARLPFGQSPYSQDELIGLSAPVQTYLWAVLKDGQPA